MKRPKTFTARLGEAAVEHGCCRFVSCGKGLFPLDARLKLEGQSVTLGCGRMVTVAAETGSRRVRNF